MSDEPISNDEMFSEELTTDSKHDTTKRIVETFKEVRAAEAQLEEISAVAESLDNVIKQAKTKTFPDLLAELGTEIWRDPETGIAVELVTAVNSSLPKDVEKRNAVLDKLRPIGIEQIMAEEFTVTFTPGDKRVHAIRALLGLNPPPVVEDEEPDGRLTNAEMDAVQTVRELLGLSDLPAEEKLGVHPARLKSWLTDMISKGFGTVIRDAGIWYGKHAQIVVPKIKKGRK